MIDISSFFAQDERVQVYRPGHCDDQGKHVLYWMQRSQRGHDNLALNAAIALGNALHVPVIVLFVLTEYPAANLRHYTFLLEGMEQTARHLQQRGTPLVMRHGSPPEEVVHFAREIKAAAVIGDECELRVPRSWRQEVKEHIKIPFACVDADVVVPSKFFPKEEWAARTIRPKIQRLLPTYLQPVSDAETNHPLRHSPVDPGKVENPLHYLDSLKIDRSVSPGELRGGQEQAMQNLKRLLEERLERYVDQRNHPEIEGTGEFSAFLHYGQISVQQLAWEVEHYVPPATRSRHIDVSSGRSAYLEELIVRRELAINFAWRNPYYDSLEGCPDWAKKTLRKHANDPREWVYTRQEFEEARTHDELWNACQRQMVITGRMHGYMRMYWGKKILEWCETPEEAFAIAVYLNDKYELDGRDANGYTGVCWAIGGKHDRPWGPERPIFGLVRCMLADGMKRKIDTRAYIHKWGASPLRDMQVPAKR